MPEMSQGPQPRAGPCTPFTMFHPLLCLTVCNTSTSPSHPFDKWAPTVGQATRQELSRCGTQSCPKGGKRIHIHTPVLFSARIHISRHCYFWRMVVPIKANMILGRTPCRCHMAYSVAYAQKERLPDFFAKKSPEGHVYTKKENESSEAHGRLIRWAFFPSKIFRDSSTGNTG